MKKKHLFLLPLLAVLLVGVFAFGFSMNNSPSNTIGEVIGYHSMVCRQVTRADGTVEPSECQHNTLYETGMDIIRTYLGDTGGAGDEVDQIELGNASSVGAGTPVVGKTEGYTAHAGCGLSIATGTYTALAEDGNWTIDNEFTNTCAAAQLTNVTRLTNTGGDDFAGVAFTLVTLQLNDKLSINWTVWST